jgi:hypothetical protein
VDRKSCFAPPLKSCLIVSEVSSFQTSFNIYLLFFWNVENCFFRLLKSIITGNRKPVHLFIVLKNNISTAKKGRKSPDTVSTSSDANVSEGRQMKKC